MLGKSVLFSSQVFCLEKCNTIAHAYNKPEMKKTHEIWRGMLNTEISKEITKIHFTVTC